MFSGASLQQTLSALHFLCLSYCKKRRFNVCVETTGTVCYVQMLDVPVVHRGGVLWYFPNLTQVFFFLKSGLNGFEEKKNLTFKDLWASILSSLYSN